MYLQQFKVEGLGCYSYLIGCPGAGTAFVVDPERHTDQYIEAARSQALTITHVLDTHLHADHISGATELARRAGAAVCVHPAVEAAYPHRPLVDGDRFDFGAARLQVIETPGHTPNSVTLAVADLARSEEAVCLLTGDLLFVADVGRPDLAGPDMLEEQVSSLHHSLYGKLGRFADHTEVYPAHGEGSLCGKGISAKPMTTLGYERRHNPLLRGMPFERFSEIMVSGFQVRPPVFAAIVEANRQGPAAISDLAPLRAMGAAEVESARAEGAVLVDVRSSVAFGAAFVGGSINIGLGPKAATWLGMVADWSRDMVLIGESETDARTAAHLFRRVGYDRIVGWLAGGVPGWAAAGRPLDHLPQLAVEGLDRVLGKYADHVVLDVRAPAEWESGHIAGAVHIPVQELVRRGIDIESDRHISVICASGYRSNIAGSYLKSQGFAHVFSIIGGMIAWQAYQAGKPRG